MSDALAAAKQAARTAAYARRAAAHAGDAGSAAGRLSELLAGHRGVPLAGYVPIRSEIDPLPAMAEASAYGPVSVPVIEANLAAYGFAARCGKVRASEVPVLSLETDKDVSCETIAAEIAAALEDDKPDAIVLGCAGMADLALTLSDRFRLPVIDGVAVAIALAEGLRAANADRWAGSGRGTRVA